MDIWHPTLGLCSRIQHRNYSKIEQLVIPDEMQNEIIRTIHEDGHFAVKKTEEIITRDY